MRRLAGGANRTWLALIGILLILLSLVWILTGFSVLRGFFAFWPQSHDSPPISTSFFEQSWVPGVLVGVGLLLAFLSLIWIFSQIPRTESAKPFRLQKNGRSGMTLMASEVLGSAIASDVESIGGVDSATVIVRGTSNRPEVYIKADVDERADISGVVDEVVTRVAKGAAESMETSLAVVAMELGVVHSKKTSKTVVL